MKHLSTKGLSMSQAQSISNLCNQRALEIQRELDSYNVCSKSIKMNGENYSLVDAYPMPSAILELLKEKGRLHATQAFLMEAIKEKECIA
jgi:predicted amidophosphoribosyltransferase